MWSKLNSDLLQYLEKQNGLISEDWELHWKINNGRQDRSIGIFQY